MRPLRRRPKQLDADPDLFDASSGGGMVLSSDGTRDARPARGRGSGGPGTTDEAAALAAAELEAVDPDGEVLARALRIARRLGLKHPPRDTTARRGGGELTSVRYRGQSDDLDLDATLANVLDEPEITEDTFVVRDRVRTKRSIVLLVDISGSMKGERARTAAAAVGALGAELARDHLAVIAFWSDAAVLQHFGPHLPAAQLVTTLLRIPPRGLTNLEFPLRVAARELSRVPSRDARVLLLSDCVHNAGPDPRPTAARLPRLDVLFDVSGEQDADLARDLARLGRGRVALVRDHRDVAPGVTRLFTPGPAR
ncbi:vWA domain-containing protein [Jatrophihabitans fulvus]